MTHHGKILEQHLVKKDITMSAFCRLIKRNRQTLYLWIKTEKFNDKIFDQITGRAGITKEMFFEIEKTEDLQNQINKLKEVVLNLQTVVLKLTLK